MIFSGGGGGGGGGEIRYLLLLISNPDPVSRQVLSPSKFQNNPNKNLAEQGNIRPGRFLV